LGGLTEELATELRGRYPDLQLEGNRLTLALSDREEIAALVARLVADGCRIYEVAPGHNSLEDIFIHLVWEGEQACG